jgi:hypothetical protein
MKAGLATLALIAPLLAAAPFAQAGPQTLALPDGLAMTLPEGWRLEGSPDGTVSKTGLRRIQLVCETEACKRTQETCTVLMRPDGGEGPDDAARLASLYAKPMDRYARLRAALKNTSRDAEVLKPLALVRYGARDWWSIETDARHNYKSGLFAETVVDTRYLGVICKTCETGSDRHAGGRALMSSLTSSGFRAAAAIR